MDRWWDPGKDMQPRGRDIAHLCVLYSSTKGTIFYKVIRNSIKLLILIKNMCTYAEGGENLLLFTCMLLLLAQVRILYSYAAVKT